MSSAHATVDDLMRTDGRAELVNGVIIPISPTGYLPAHVSLRILLSLDAHARILGIGEVFMSKLAYVIDRVGAGAG